MSGNETWFVRMNGMIRGPFALTNLRSMRDRGRITQSTEISRDRRIWITADLLPDFFSSPQQIGTQEQPTLPEATNSHVLVGPPNHAGPHSESLGDAPPRCRADIGSLHEGSAHKFPTPARSGSTARRSSEKRKYPAFQLAAIAGGGISGIIAGAVIISVVAKMDLTQFDRQEEMANHVETNDDGEEASHKHSVRLNAVEQAKPQHEIPGSTRASSASPRQDLRSAGNSVKSSAVVEQKPRKRTIETEMLDLLSAAQDVDDKDELVRVARDFTRSHPNQPHIWYQAAFAFLKVDDNELAIEAATRCLELNESKSHNAQHFSDKAMARVWRCLAAAHVAKSEFTRGLSCLQRAADLNRSHAPEVELLLKYIENTKPIPEAFGQAADITDRHPQELETVLNVDGVVSLSDPEFEEIRGKIVGICHDHSVILVVHGEKAKKTRKLKFPPGVIREVFRANESELLRRSEVSHAGRDPRPAFDDYVFWYLKFESVWDHDRKQPSNPKFHGYRSVHRGRGLTHEGSYKRVKVSDVVNRWRATPSSFVALSTWSRKWAAYRRENSHRRDYFVRVDAAPYLNLTPEARRAYPAYEGSTLEREAMGVLLFLGTVGAGAQALTKDDEDPIAEMIDIYNDMNADTKMQTIRGGVRLYDAARFISEVVKEDRLRPASGGGEDSH